MLIFHKTRGVAREHGLHIFDGASVESSKVDFGNFAETREGKAGIFEIWSSDFWGFNFCDTTVAMKERFEGSECRSILGGGWPNNFTWPR